MAEQIQFAPPPVKRGVRLEDVLKRINPVESPSSGETWELNQNLREWKARWENRQEQISRRLQLLHSALEEGSIAEAAE